MGHCDSVYLSEVGDTQVVVFKHGMFVFKGDGVVLSLIGVVINDFCSNIFSKELCLLAFTEKEDGSIATILIRGSTDNLMDDVERAVDDGVNTFKVLTRVSKLPPP